MRAPLLGAALALSLAACDAPRPTSTSAVAERPDARPPPPPPPPVPADRVVTRTLLSYYHWLRSDAPLPGEAHGVEHARVDLTLVVEVHKNPVGEGWVTVGALAPNVDVPEHPYLRAEGATVTWHVPSGGFNDPRKEPFGGEFRGDEPIRAYLAAQPDAVVTVTVTPANAPEAQRLPTSGTLPVTQRSGAGQYDAALVVVLPMRNRGGRRYLLQALDLSAQPGGFGQNGVMDHVPTRAEVDRYLVWMRDPRGRRPPVAALPIDRS